MVNTSSGVAFAGSIVQLSITLLTFSAIFAVMVSVVVPSGMVTVQGYSVGRRHVAAADVSAVLAVYT